MDGFVVDERDYQESIKKVKQRASFELSCEAEKLELKVLDVKEHDGTAGSWVRQIGVTGCGQKAVYVWASRKAGWVMNTTTD